MGASDNEGFHTYLSARPFAFSVFFSISILYTR